MIEEDFERLSELDQMYLWEREREIVDEWMEWEEEQRKKEENKEVVMSIVMKLKDEQELQETPNIQIKKSVEAEEAL